MTQPMIWVHGDNLNPYAPTFRQYSDAPALFVFDEELLDEWNISFKRIVFLYECLLELPVSIRKGNIVREILHFSEEYQATELITMHSPSPRFYSILDLIETSSRSIVETTILNKPAMIDSDYEFDLKRFSRFWRKAKPFAMRYR